MPTRPSYPVTISITVQLCTFSKLKLSHTVVKPRAASSAREQIHIVCDESVVEHNAQK
jgi:hypothetical protein